ncbi:MAG: hypothetical protein HYV13_00435 [Candidatus Doudnabacteria bacterium]|nr:hypothetical protein [Candidatus Doudnabacteria bacterium]
MPNNDLEQEPVSPEIRESAELKESAKDEVYEQAVKGAEILENPPPNGSFFYGLQVFVAWVKNLVSGKQDD